MHSSYTFVLLTLLLLNLKWVHDVVVFCCNIWQKNAVEITTDMSVTQFNWIGQYNVMSCVDNGYG